MNFYNIKFINIYFFRKLFKYNTYNHSYKFKKPIILDDINIVCLPPFDINIIFFVIGKLLKPNSILILHTSDLLHNKGYIFKTKFTKYIYIFCINKYFNIIVYPNKLLLDQLNINYKIPKLYIPHHIKPCFISNIKNYKKDIDIIFVGEKSYKKGYDRFINISNILNLKSYSIGDSLINFNIDNNIVELDNISSNELSNYLIRSKFLILPSRKHKNWEELFSQISLEAISCGIIVISTNHIGPTFLKYFYNLPIYIFEDNNYFEINVTNFIINYKNVEFEFDLSDFYIENLILKWDHIFNL